VCYVPVRLLLAEGEEDVEESSDEEDDGFAAEALQVLYAAC